MSRAHAVLSASSSSRWIACPPSALLQEKYSITTADDFDVDDEDDGDDDFLM